jgi:Ca2+-binding EF-hand superfamily protein
MAKLNDDELKQVFDAFDADKQGTISAKEFINVLRQAGVTPEQASDDIIAQIIQAFDQDGNGSLNFPEFKNLLNEVLSKCNQ